MGSITSPAGSVTAPFQTLTGLIDLASNSKRASETLDKLAAATAQHEAAQRAAVAVKTEAANAIQKAEALAAANEKAQKEIAAAQNKLAADQAALAEAQRKHVDEVKNFSADTAAKRFEAERMKAESEKLYAAAKVAQANAIADRDLSAKARAEAEDALNKLRPLLKAVGV